MTRLDPRPTQARAPRTRLLPRSDPLTRLPLLILYPHSRCNCRCVMCDIWRTTGREELDADEVTGWLPELRALGVRRVVLSGGEALLHSRLWEICRALREAGIGVTVLSTGILLARHAADVVAYCDDVVVSLDGPPQVHDAIRRIPAAYEKLARGVAAVRAADAAGSARITARCTVQRSNHAQLRATLATALDLGLDGISFLAADVSSEAFNRPGGWSAERVREVALDAAELAALSEELDALEAEHAGEFARGYVAESPAKLRRRLVRHFGALLGDGDFAPQRCNAPWVSAVVETDGSVRPCFFQPPLGNLREAGSLGAVINSPAARAWRQGLDMSRDEICRRCVCSLALHADDEAALAAPIAGAAA